MVHDEREVFVFNPGYVMRNDSHRVVLFSGGQSNVMSAPLWESFIHPVHARIFSFFTFNRPLQATITMLSNFLKREPDAVRKMVYPFIENPLSVYTKYKDEKVRIPKNVIVNRNRIAGNVAFLNLEPNVFDCRNIDLSTERAYTGPKLLTFMLNNDCVSNCIYCYADVKKKVKKRITTPRIFELIEEARTLPVQLINLMGGELFLHPDWFFILKKLVDLYLAPEYISTKYPITGDIIRSLQMTGFTNPVQVSLDAGSFEILQKMLSVKSDYLSKILNGIKELDNSGLSYRVNSVLTTFNTNKEAIASLFRFLNELKSITDWRITPAVNSNWIDYERFIEIKPCKDEIENLFSYIEKEIIPYSRFPILLNRAAMNKDYRYCTTGSKDFKGVKCSALNSHLFILPDGRATICEQLYWLPQFIIGDVTVNSISEVWNSPASEKLLNLHRTDIQDNSPCKRCELFESCFAARNRCWVDIVKVYGKENWDYPDPRCAYAPPLINELNY